MNWFAIIHCNRVVDKSLRGIVMKWMMYSVLAIAPVFSMAQSASAPSATNRQINPDPRASVHKAFEECKKVGKPGHVEFQQCMESKGFKRPEIPAQLKAAIEECKKQGTRASPEFRACMEKKGFLRKKPA